MIARGIPAMLLVMSGVAHAGPYLAGDRATGSWGGARDALGDHGASIDVVYSAEGYDALGQDGRGDGVNTLVGSATPVSNLEAPPLTQLAELSYQQALGPLTVRVGKQDANRDFGTPRFAGNFVNGTLGMFANVPLPSFPITGLGAFAAGRDGALTVKGGVYEGSPQLESFGVDSALADGAGYVAVADAEVVARFAGRDESTTGAGVWHRGGDLAADDGLFVQSDEHLFAHPRDPADASGLTVIVRYAHARPSRDPIPTSIGGSAAWHGLGWRHDDTVGIAGGYLTLAPRGSEWFVEATYKWRLTRSFSLQPDVELYRHPAGAGDDALLFGRRVKVKL